MQSTELVRGRHYSKPAMLLTIASVFCDRLELLGRASPFGN